MKGGLGCMCRQEKKMRLLRSLEARLQFWLVISWYILGNREMFCLIKEILEIEGEEEGFFS